MSDLKLQGEVSFDTSKADEALGRVEQSAGRMAQAVGKAGDTAGASVGKIGGGGDQAAQKLESATRSMIGSIQRTTAALEAGSRSGSKYYEVLAAQRGINPEVLKPYLTQLDAASAAQAAATVAVGGTSHAMEGFSLNTSIARRELLTITRELAKGEFARAGTSMLTLAGHTGATSLLFTAAGIATVGLVAAIGGLTVAAALGAKELKAYQDAATITGNAIGVSTSQFTQFRDAITGIGATKGKAAEVLTEIAANGKIAGTAVKSIAEAAILMEKATGQATSKTIEQFAELAKSPAEAAAKLNEQYNFLTAGVYKQIKALEDEGKQVQAANIAEQAYADALKTRAGDIVNSAGIIEKAWRGVTGAAKGAWDAMLGIGRDVSTVERMAIAQAAIARGRAPFDPSAFGGNAEARANIPGNQDLSNQLLRKLEIEQRNTAEKAEQNRLAQIGISFEKQGENFLTKQQQREKELTKARTEGQELVNAGIITEEELTKRLTNIRLKYNETRGASDVAAQRAAQLIAQAETARLQKSIDTLDFSTPTKLTGAEQKVILIQEQLKEGLLGVARANKVRELAAAEAAVQDEKTVVLLTKQYEAVKKSHEQLVQVAVTTGQQADAINEQAKAQEAANAVYGKGTTAIQAMTLAELKHQLAEADSSDRFDPAYVAALNAKVAAQQRFVDALGKSDFKVLNQQADEFTRSVAEQSKMFADEAQLASVTVIEREKILAVRKVEEDIAKRIADIDRSSLSDAEKGQLRDKINLAGVQAKNDAVAKVVASDWQRTADSINSSLTDALVTAFDSGKTLAGNLRDAIVSMFKNLVLRPTISAVMSPISGAITSIVQPLVGGLTSGVSSALGLSNAGSSLSSLFGGGASTAASSITAASSAADTLAAITAEQTAAAGGISGVMAAIPGVGWAALGVAVVASLFGGSKGGPKVEGGTGWGIGQGSFGDVTGAKTFTDALTASYLDSAKQLGVTAAAVQFGTLFSKDPQGTSQTQLQVTAGLNNRTLYSRVADTGGLENVGRSDAELQAAIAQSSARAVLSALQATDMPAKLAEYFKTLDPLQLTADQIQSSITAAANAQVLWTAFGQLGDSFANLASMSVSAAAAFTDAAGGIEALKTNLASYYENFYTAEEKKRNVAASIAQTVTGAGFTVTADTVLTSTREQFRALMDQYLAMGEAGQPVVQALLSVNAAFASIIPASTDVAAAVDAISQAMKNLQNDTAKLQIELLTAQGNTAGASAAQRTLDTVGLTAAEIAVYDYNQSLRDQIKALNDAKTAADAAAAAQKQAINDSYSAVDRAVSAEKDAANIRLGLAQEQVTALQGVFDLLKGQISGLYGEVAGTAAMGAAGGQKFIADALQAARSTGYLPDASQLSDAITAARGGLGDNNYKSAFDQARDRLVLANKLTELQKIAGPQLTAAEQQVKAAQDQIKALDDVLVEAKKQVDALNGIDDSVLSVTDAVNRLYTLLDPNKKQAAAVTAATSNSSGGFAMVGGSGTIAEGSPSFNLKDFQLMWTDYNNAPGVVARYLKSYGQTEESAAAALGLDPEMVRLYFDRAGIPRFAGGGNFGGGMALVGEHGPELVQLPQSHIYTAGQTSAMLDNTEVVAAIDRLASRLSSIEASSKKTSDTLVRVTRDGNALLTAAA